MRLPGQVDQLSKEASKKANLTAMLLSQTSGEDSKENGRMEKLTERVRGMSK